MSDVKFEHVAGTGGDITIENGIAELTGGIDVAMYLSLFGGNDEGTWWGDLSEVNSSYRYPARTQQVIKEALTSAIVPTLEATAKADLNWMLLDGIISSLDVEVSILDVNKVQYDIIIEAQGEQKNFRYTENWEETPAINPVQKLSFPAPIIGWIPTSKALHPVTPAVVGDGYLPTDIKE